MDDRFTPAERVMRALNGAPLDKPPFTSYECFVQPCTDERILRERGMCIVYRTRSYTLETPDVKVTARHYRDERGARLIRTEYETPVGTLHTTQEQSELTTWAHSYMFKTPDDYKPLQFILDNTVVRENLGGVQKLMDDLGGDFIVRDGLPLEPLQQFISGAYMDPENFSYEWYDNRDMLLSLYRSACRINEQCLAIVAKSPAKIVNYGGNVVPQIIGREIFQQYYMPHYEMACSVLHASGKLVGCHFDANNAPIMDLIAKTPLDYIEAYDPGISPGLADAVAAFQDKAIWINWPSPWHLNPLAQIESDTVSLLSQAKGFKKLLVGITEDVPPDRWRKVYASIMNGIDTYCAG